MPFFYSIFRFFYLLGAVNALFFAFLIFSRCNRKRSDAILAVWLLFLTVQLVIPFIYMSNIRALGYMIGYESTLLTLHPIFLYNYSLTLANEKRKLKSILLSFTPTIPVALSMLVMVDMSSAEKLHMVTSSQLPPLSVFPAFILSMIVFIWYIVAAFNVQKKHKQQVLQVYSYRDNVDLLWLRRLTLSFTILFAVDLLLAAIFWIVGVPLPFADFCFYTMLTIFIFLLGYFGYRQGEIFRFEQLNIAREDHETHVKEELHSHKTEVPVINREYEIALASDEAEPPA